MNKVLEHKFYLGWMAVIAVIKNSKKQFGFWDKIITFTIIHLPYPLSKYATRLYTKLMIR